ncbi:hypothetical protein GQ55_8G175000 [Panicum hallii var. hallii]|uniref:Uncharacterized protein n=1 Tax=Panicum hallii var. hallii TaxID=1504633 RepID=A0A2T7CNM3_9POAL|nr:hypothetical protein GQ55_8G175000 [Panicum hallii var. hallii]
MAFPPPNPLRFYPHHDTFGSLPLDDSRRRGGAAREATRWRRERWGGVRGDKAAARGGKAAARHISPDSYHHDGDGDLLPSDVDAPHPLLADPSSTGLCWRR